MTVTRKKLVYLLVASFILVGCAGVASVEPGGGKKISAADITYDQLWLKVLQVMTKGFDIKELDKGKGYIKATKALWGIREYLYVFITPEGGAEDRFQVEVISTRRSGDFRKWDELVLSDIKGRLGHKPRNDD